MQRRVLITADVLYPSALRSTLLRLADAGFFEPRWTSAILAEARQKILASRPELHERQLQRITMLMRDVFPEADVLDYEAQLEKIPRSLKDRDVLAAAMAARVDAIVATDRVRFAPELYGQMGIAVLTPDMLLCRCLDEEPEVVIQTLMEEGAQRAASPMKVLTPLSSQAPQFAERVAEVLSPGTSTMQFRKTMPLE
jgi:predicted nucleic acid-binding protein